MQEADSPLSSLSTHCLGFAIEARNRGTSNLSPSRSLVLVGALLYVLFGRLISSKNLIHIWLMKTGVNVTSTIHSSLSNLSHSSWPSYTYIFDEEQESKVEDVGEFSTQGLYASRRTVDIDLKDEQEDDNDYAAGFSGKGANAGKQEKDYDRDPEFAEIIGSCLDDPNKARSKIEERFRQKRSKILHTKTGSGVPMKVSFNKFDFSNSYIWIEFYNTPLAKDISLLCDTIRAWHIVGRLGGCNSMNMQLSQSPLDKRPSYDYIQGSNVTPSTFYNIGDLEVQDNLARIWVDIGTNESLLLDVLINALTQISSDFVGIKQVMFGGAEFENWKENLTSEEAGYSMHKI
ncbi:hypothetical protein K1719_002439 [Acacia pycnantha]|nr:hypothetical protein K1719_002439 [Acacia pycnantha]